jgi:hypothetical protein
MALQQLALPDNLIPGTPEDASPEAQASQVNPLSVTMSLYDFGKILTCFLTFV